MEEELQNNIASERRKIGSGIKNPWYSRLGIYSHFKVEVEGLTIRFIPNFMFGAPQATVDWLYGSADSIPINSMMTENIGKDRILVQCFMNIVTLAVIFLLWFHNKTAKM